LVDTAVGELGDAIPTTDQKQKENEPSCSHQAKQKGIFICCCLTHIIV